MGGAAYRVPRPPPPISNRAGAITYYNSCTGAVRMSEDKVCITSSIQPDKQVPPVILSNFVPLKDRASNTAKELKSKEPRDNAKLLKAISATCYWIVALSSIGYAIFHMTQWGR
jgi:hypothetical protein